MAEAREAVIARTRATGEAGIVITHAMVRKEMLRRAVSSMHDKVLETIPALVLTDSCVRLATRYPGRILHLRMCSTTLITARSFPFVRVHSGTRARRFATGAAWCSCAFVTPRAHDECCWRRLRRTFDAE